jgi:hypothetical protein
MVTPFPNLLNGILIDFPLSCLQDGLSKHGSQLLPTLDHVCLVDALVATLKSESGYCVATAATALATIGQTQDGGMALIEASGAIAGLVSVIKRTRWPHEPEKEAGRFGRWAHEHLALSLSLSLSLCLCLSLSLSLSLFLSLSV